MSKRERCEAAARKWAREEVERELRELCETFGQASPVVIEPDDPYLAGLERDGISYGGTFGTMGGSGWIEGDGIDWTKHMVPYFDETAKVEKQRLPEDHEKRRILVQLNRDWIQDCIRHDWGVTMDTAVRALANRLLGVEKRDRVKVVREDGGAVLYHGPWGGPLKRVVLRDVEVCLIADAYGGDILHIDVCAYDTIDDPWAQGRHCVIVRANACPQVVLRPVGR